MGGGGNRRLVTSWSAAALALAASACSTPPRRSVEELYREALEATRLVGDPAEAEARRASAERTPETTACPGDEAELAGGLLAPVRGGPLVADAFVDTDIREALQSLANQAGVRVAVGDGIRGTVSAVFEQVPFEEALADLLTPRGYMYERMGERYLVGSADPTSPMFPSIARTSTYVPRHLTTLELLEALPKFATPLPERERRAQPHDRHRAQGPRAAPPP